MTNHQSLEGLARRGPPARGGRWTLAAWATIALAMPLPAAAASGHPVEPTRHRFLIVRYDDYSPVVPYRRVSVGVELERRIFELFRRYDARLVVGVIPFPIHDQTVPRRTLVSTSADASWLSDPNDPWVRLLREYVGLGTVEAALHGLEHRRRSPAGHRPGEFRWQSPQWQHGALRLGRDVLASAIGRPVRVFVPPWNAWDDATARCLATLGFDWISPDFHPIDAPIGTIRVVPQCASDVESVFEWMRSAKPPPPGAIVVLTTHPFDFEGDQAEANLRSLEALLAHVAASPEWACVGLSDLPRRSLEEWRRRWRAALIWHGSRRLLDDAGIASSFVRDDRATCYAPEEWYRSRQIPWRLAVGATAILSLLVGWVGSRAMARYGFRTRGGSRMVGYLAAIGLVVLVLGAAEIARHGYVIRGVRWQAICVAVGATLGFLIRRRRGVREEHDKDARRWRTPPSTPDMRPIAHSR
ncbi:MAG: DUF2334 domain-containing protein [Phycisphaerae bacterium]|nr:DUF2334 domain-containing protein [Phycisphaerae bacterium]